MVAAEVLPAHDFDFDSVADPKCHTMHSDGFKEAEACLYQLFNCRGPHIYF